MATEQRSEDDSLLGDESTVEDLETGEEEIETRVGWRYTLTQIRRDPTALAGLLTIGFMTLVAIFATIDAVLFDFLSQYQVFAQFGMEKYWIAKTVWISPIEEPAGTKTLLPPVGLENGYGQGTLAHPLGTDERGRDILLRLIYGSRIAVTVGFFATFVGMLGGVTFGSIAGYYGGWVDDVLMRAVEALQSIPFLVLVLAVLSVLRQYDVGSTLWFVIVAVGVASIPTFARLIRSRVVSVREEDYIEAARAAGVRDRNIIFRHVIPNSFAPVLVQGTLQIGTAILLVAGLSFLGFGVQPPTPSWGQMLSSSRNYMIADVWYSIWPGLAILVTVVGFNIFGDGLRDALDPRLKN